MKVLDLFAGLKGWSAAFEDRGHEVFSIELDQSFPDISWYGDVRNFRPDAYDPDIILASPPCQGFSVMGIGRNWTRDHQPKTEKAELAVDLVKATRYLIDMMQPRFFVIENPRAKLRKLPVMADLERRTVTYCQLGEQRMKPTDLWGGFPPSLVLPPTCKNGDGCHVAAPRGSTTGTQGMTSAQAAKVPYQLSELVCLAAERDLGGSHGG